MNTFFTFHFLGKWSSCKQILSDLKWGKIISQHTLLKLWAYADFYQNNKIARYADCVPNNASIELKKVML